MLQICDSCLKHLDSPRRHSKTVQRCWAALTAEKRNFEVRVSCLANLWPWNILAILDLEATNVVLIGENQISWKLGIVKPSSSIHLLLDEQHPDSLPSIILHTFFYGLLSFLFVEFFLLFFFLVLLFGFALFALFQLFFLVLCLLGLSLCSGCPTFSDLATKK